MAIRSHYSRVIPYRTKDGSLIRELMHPACHGNHAQSLAEATIEPGIATQLHMHRHSEELYYIVEGQGVMTMGREAFSVAAGDTVCIPPATPHAISNSGSIPLRILCACSPAYSHEDTILL